ncbi:MAG: hypothetical protein JWL72_4574 [Ilumatobacteraceae bacterium]|nr:hypothetical protein [Ilumatobacteraceae bacterium]MCU1391236.1 hypothetical protein [Ilumatobacteraceae bacterium]
MAAPKFAPVSATDVVRTYESPEHVPQAWSPDRPAEIHGRQPEGARLGYQGPDQGYVLTLSERFRSRIVVAAGESVNDAIRGSINIALRRASLFGRAPVVHDLTIAFTIWGWLDASAAADLVSRRSALFEGVANTDHHYTEGRLIADLVPESTLRLTPDAATSAYAAGKWRELTGA